MNHGDIIRVGKKLFKIWRIELESKKSKEQFLKKAQKFEFKKIDLCKNKSKSTLMHSETTRMSKSLANRQKNGIHTYDEDVHGQMGSLNTVHGQMQFHTKTENLKSSHDYRINTDNLINDEHMRMNKTKTDHDDKVKHNFMKTKSKTIDDQQLLMDQDNPITFYDIKEENDDDNQESQMFHQINVEEAKREKKSFETDDDLLDEHEHSRQDVSQSKHDDVQSGENTTSEEEEEDVEEDEKPLIKSSYSSKHLKIQSKIENENDVSKSEVDLEGIYNAEQNEFIKVMVCPNLLINIFRWMQKTRKIIIFRRMAIIAEFV